MPWTEPCLPFLRLILPTSSARLRRRSWSMCAQRQTWPLLIGSFRAQSIARTTMSNSSWRALPAKRPVVVCDLSGSQTSWTVVEALCRFGADASYLMDGFAGWYDRGFPTRRHVGSLLDKWVTREHPKIDRIACPWLISRFVNPLGEFIYVPPSDVLAVAKQTGAIPYDIKGVDFGHVGDRCSFDAIIRDSRHQGSRARPSRHHRAGRGHLATGPRAAMRRAARRLLRALGQFPRRPRDAQAWDGHL